MFIIHVKRDGSGYLSSFCFVVDGCNLPSDWVRTLVRRIMQSHYTADMKAALAAALYQHDYSIQCA